MPSGDQEKRDTPPPEPRSAAPESGNASRNDSLAERLRGLYGEGVDPEITLEGENSQAGDASAEVVRRLGAHSGGFGRYRLKDELARGGQGTILRVWDEDLRRSLAMKVILGKDEQRSGSVHVDTRSLGRFLEEAQVTGQLDHPGIVPVHELGLDSKGRLYFTMKLVRGRDLKAIYRLVHEGQEGWNVTRALGILLRMCEAMSYAHSKGVIHRDLKPGNVMVGRFGEVYVMDWGLARVLGRPDHRNVRIQPAEMTQTFNLAMHDKGSQASDAPLLTMDGDVVGTPAYMSPEQANGDIEKMGPHSDVYSAGAMIYQLLARQLPYLPPGVKLSNYAVWYRVQEGPPTPLHALAPDTPAELIAICEKAMARDPAERYRDMSQLAEDLRAYLEHRVVHAYETGAVAELRKWISRNRPLALSVAAGLVLALGGLTAVGLVEAHGRRTADALRARADESARIAREQEELARRERSSVLRLSALHDVEELRDGLEDLWPPHPEQVLALEGWLRRARALRDGVEAPSGEYPGHARQLELLRERALPASAEELEQARLRHGRLPELLALRSRVESLRRAARVRAGLELTEPQLDLAALPADTLLINDRAWSFAGPARKVHGRETEGLALARLAYSRAKNDEERAMTGDTLAWALFTNGLEMEALERSLDAARSAPPALRAEIEGNREKLERLVVEREGGALEVELADGERELEALEAEVGAAREWRFENPEDQAWHDQLARLVSEIEDFSAGPRSVMTAPVITKVGWGVERRLEFARGIEERTLSGTAARETWEKALASIADREECPLYDGLALDPQLGLLPLGRDPRSGLWEFAHLQSGEPPSRDPNGQLVVGEESSLVLVLLPGGSFLMGAQRPWPDRPGHDPGAEKHESPPHRVRVSPFFLSKYEMNQAQWERGTGENPSFYRDEDVASPLHPVEAVSWTDCTRIVRRLGLTLPTEAQWEYAARAGTTTPWWSGADPRVLAGQIHAGTTDQAHLAVDQLAANPFGLHNILGNVWEFCRDSYDDEAYGWHDLLDPECVIMGWPARVMRGGGYGYSFEYARCSKRVMITEDYLHQALGLRPARALVVQGGSAAR